MTATVRSAFLDEGCPHRNASLVLARNEECGLRCIFHGWKVDVTGQVVDAPTHSPNPEAFAAKITARRYPTVEGGGLVWVWLGEREAPPFPHLPFTLLPDSHVWVTATNCACNWLQGVEATLDTAHIGTLHKAYIEAYSEADAGSSIKNSLDSLAPRYDVEHTDYGLDAIGTRPMPDGSAYVRTTKYVLPFVSLVPGSPGSAGGDVDGVIFIVSPVDDTHHVLFFGFWSVTREINDGLYLGVPPAQQSTRRRPALRRQQLRRASPAAVTRTGARTVRPCSTGTSAASPGTSSRRTPSRSSAWGRSSTARRSTSRAATSRSSTPGGCSLEALDNVAGGQRAGRARARGRPPRRRPHRRRRPTGAAREQAVSAG